MDVFHLIERIGAYAGFFAVIGLAVLSALYFAQARDVRRLREWAGRSPERAQQAPMAPSAPAPSTGARPEQGAAGAAAPLAGPGPSTAAAAGPSVSPQTGTLAPPGAAAGNGGSGPDSPNGSATGGPPPVRQLGGPVTSRTQHIPPLASAPAEGRGGLAPRYLALIVAGVLIVGAGVAYAVVWSSQPTAPPPMAQQGPAPVVPQSVTVSVLNGTTVPGLAATVGDKVESAGFRLGNVTNATEQQRAESSILFLPGADREARMVGRKLRIPQVERAASSDRVLAGTARVIVVVGADQGK